MPRVMRYDKCPLGPATQPKGIFDRQFAVERDRLSFRVVWFGYLCLRQRAWVMPNFLTL